MIEVLKDCLHHKSIVKAFLVGSFASDYHNCKSDIDLLIMFDFNKISIGTIEKIKQEIAKSTRRKSDIIIWQFVRDDKVRSNMLRDAIRLI